jgi:hypothetical protein
MVRGARKVKLHLMFGVIALFADQLMKLIAERTGYREIRNNQTDRIGNVPTSSMIPNYYCNK